MQNPQHYLTTLVSENMIPRHASASKTHIIITCFSSRIGKPFSTPMYSRFLKTSTTDRNVFKYSLSDDKISLAADTRAGEASFQKPCEPFGLCMSGEPGELWAGEYGSTSEWTDMARLLKCEPTEEHRNDIAPLYTLSSCSNMKLPIQGLLVLWLLNVGVCLRVFVYKEQNIKRRSTIQKTLSGSKLRLTADFVTEKERCWCSRSADLTCISNSKFEL